jgi:hypothetical protein
LSEGLQGAAIAKVQVEVVGNAHFNHTRHSLKDAEKEKLMGK